MESFKLQDLQSNFLNRLDDEIKHAEDNYEKENQSAILIQKRFRGVILRNIIQKQHYAVNLIQKLFRNHVDYKKFCNIKNNFYEEKQLKFYNYLVLQIQRCFRGYYSRKYKSDMKKRKKYIQELQEKNDELIRSMSAYAEKQLEEDYLYQKKLKEEKFFKLAQNLHHLTSTKQIPGVYNPNPYLMNVPTLNNIPVEEHIRGAVRDLLRTRTKGISIDDVFEEGVDPMREGEKGRWKKKTLIRDIYGTLKVPLTGYQKYRLSLQASTPYDIMKEHEKKEKILHNILVNNRKIFLAGGKTKLLAKDTPSILINIPYMDPWANPYNFKGVPESQSQLLKSSHDFKPYFVTQNSLKNKTQSYVTSVGGNHSTALPNNLFDVIKESSEFGGAVHRNLGVTNERFGLANTMDSRSLPNFNKIYNETSTYRDLIVKKDSKLIKTTTKNTKFYSIRDIKMYGKHHEELMKSQSNSTILPGLDGKDIEKKSNNEEETEDDNLLMINTRANSTTSLNSYQDTIQKNTYPYKISNHNVDSDDD